MNISIFTCFFGDDAVQLLIGMPRLGADQKPMRAPVGH